MAVVEYNYLKSLEKSLTIATVQLEIVPNQLQEHKIVIDSPKNTPFSSQGDIEAGYKNWNASAKNALRIAIEKISLPTKLDITIKHLQGRILIDSNNASIGVACVMALYEYLKIKPNNDMVEKIHRFVQEDWKNEVSVLPDLNEIFEN